MKLALVSLAALAACGDDPVHHLPDGPHSLATPGIYVTMAGGAGGIVVFAPDATGDATPLRTIAGPTTGMSLPIGLAVDHQGLVYTANRTGSSITAYPKDGSGDLAPVRTLTAPTMLSPETLQIDDDDNVFAATCPNCGQAAGGDIGIFHFPAGSATSDYELAGASTLMTNPGLVLDATHELVVGNSFGGVIATFAPDAKGDTAPLRSFTPAGGLNIQSIAVVGSALLVTSPSGGYQLYDAQATGDAVQPVATLDASALAVSYPAGVMLDTSVSPAQLYVADFGAGAIVIADASGSGTSLAISNVRKITGPSTTLNQPLGVVIIH